MNQPLAGIFTPNITPLDSRGQLDEDKLRGYVDWLIDRGVHGLYPNGSTGEFVRFTPEERRRVIEIVVDQTMATGRPGLWAAGDITTYPGKLKLIATGFAEASMAVNQAVHWIYPDKKVNPGHSSNLAVFGQKDE